MMRVLLFVLDVSMLRECVIGFTQVKEWSGRNIISQGQGKVSEF